MWPSVVWSHRQLNTQAVRVSFDRSVAELVVGWTISRPDVNRLWRRRRFVTTADGIMPQLDECRAVILDMCN